METTSRTPMHYVGTGAVVDAVCAGCDAYIGLTQANAIYGIVWEDGYTPGVTDPPLDRPARVEAFYCPRCYAKLKG